jgi:hypothetical protein
MFTDYGGPTYKNATEAFAATIHEVTLDCDHTNLTDVDTKEWTALDNVAHKLAASLTEVYVPYL